MLLIRVRETTQEGEKGGGRTGPDSPFCCCSCKGRRGKVRVRTADYYCNLSLSAGGRKKREREDGNLLSMSTYKIVGEKD